MIDHDCKFVKCKFGSQAYVTVFIMNIIMHINLGTKINELVYANIGINIRENAAKVVIFSLVVVNYQ